MPGYGDTGPTLEIYQYKAMEEKLATAANRKGFDHIAFSVDNIQDPLDLILSKGGRAIGKIVSVEVSGVGQITFTYAADPEGNLIEIQKWS